MATGRCRQHRADRHLSRRALQGQSPSDAPPTEPYFTRPNIEQPYYDLTNPAYRERSFAPWPLAAWAEFSFDGLPIRVGQVVQTMQRELGPGGIYEPLVITPPSASALTRKHAFCSRWLRAARPRHRPRPGRSRRNVSLTLPAGWTAQPASAPFHLAAAGNTEPILFSVTAAAAETGSFTIKAVTQSAGHSYESGWESVGYPGLRPYNLYKPPSSSPAK